MEGVLTEIRDLLKELVERVPPPPEPVVDDNFTCEGTTAKGKKCTNRRMPSSEYCGMHGGNKKRKVVGSASSVVGKKIVPVHTDCSGGSCDLCSHHGNVLDEGVVDSHYNVTETE
jgi:hypothetical protein